MDAKQLTAHYLSTLIVFTTIHAQDFQDIVGDLLENRRTIPIVLPTLGRLSMPLTLLIWSTGLSLEYSSSFLTSFALIMTGAIVGARFWFLRNAEADRTSYVCYNVRSHRSHRFLPNKLRVIRSGFPWHVSFQCSQALRED